jgi:hypothetical protein
MAARRFLLAALVLLSIVGPPGKSQAAPIGTAFTYQGRLSDGGNPATGTYDFRFIVYDADVGGSQRGPTLTRDDVAVAGGLFTVPLDFGAVFDGNARFLEIAIRPGASGGTYTPLAARQELTPSPHAVFSATTGDATVQRRTVAPTCAVGEYIRSIAADGTPTCASDVDTNSGGDITEVIAGAGISGGGTSGSVTLDLDACAAGLVLKSNGPGWTCAAAGPITTVSFGGSIGAITGPSADYVFAGPTAQVTTTPAAPRLTGAGVAPLRLLSGGPITADVGLCYQSTVPASPLVNFAGFTYMTVQITTTLVPYAASFSVTPPLGTYNVGMCVRNSSATSINFNDYANGWVQVTN